MSQPFQFVAGSTFVFDAALKEGQTPVDITGWQIEAEVRYRGQSVCKPSVTVTQAAQGTYRILHPDSLTLRWPVGLLQFSLRYVTAAGQVILAEPIDIACKRV